MRELQDMDVGIIAASRVGREVIAMLKTYSRINIKCYDPYLKPEAAEKLGVTLVSLQEACRCEVVSIHAPNIPETNRMFNARTLALLPDNAVLINTARGALVDEDALVNELKRRPLYACLDVTDPEPPKPDSPLRTAPNLILTPHVAGAVQQGCRDMGQLAIDEVLRFIAGEKLQHEVTREMMPTQA
jgi:phosphoglycerate dehydrogenase-like enzyme